MQCARQGPLECGELQNYTWLFWSRDFFFCQQSVGCALALQVCHICTIFVHLYVVVTKVSVSTKLNDVISVDPLTLYHYVHIVGKSRSEGGKWNVIVFIFLINHPFRDLYKRRGEYAEYLVYYSTLYSYLDGYSEHLTQFQDLLMSKNIWADLNTSVFSLIYKLYSFKTWKVPTSVETVFHLHMVYWFFQWMIICRYPFVKVLTRF